MKPSFIIYVAWGLAALSIAAGDETIDAASGRTKTDIARAAEELAHARAAIVQERDGLAQQLRDLEEEVADLRARAASAGELEARLRRREDELTRRETALAGRRRAVVAAVGEFRRAIEARMCIVQRHAQHGNLDALDAALADAGREPFDLSALVPTLNLIDALIRQDTVARPIAGSALDASGILHEGSFVRVGPEAFFVGSEGRLRGHVQLDVSGEKPLIITAARKGFDAALPALMNGERATLPVDVSGGALQAVTRARLSLPERLRQGGVVMIPLLGIGSIAFIAGLLRYVALMRMSAGGSSLLNRLIPSLDAGETDAARREAEAAPAPWRETLMDAVDHWQEDRAYLEEILQDRIAAAQLDLNRYLPMLAICAAAAPLLGLLGTVTGMIHTFQLITVFGTGDARALSGGISEALITTQVGLIIAVPALLAHAYLSRKAKGILSELENVAIRLVRHAAPESREDSCKT